MKTVIAIALLFATSASAETVRATVKDHYKLQNIETPITQTYCRQGNAGQGALEGMIIGGLLGKGLTGDDQGAAAGAVLGGVIGADKAGRKCWEEITYVTERSEVYSHSTITFKQNGQTYSFDFYK
jgi:uncharacterized protein YcfJ